VPRRRSFLAIAAFLSGEGVSRRVLLERGVLFTLAPSVLPVVLGFVDNGIPLLFPDMPITANKSPSRLHDVVIDLLLVTYGSVGIFCECVALSFFDKLDKPKRKFDLITALALLVGLFSGFIILMLMGLSLMYGVDLIDPGARIFPP